MTRACDSCENMKEEVCTLYNLSPPLWWQFCVDWKEKEKEEG